MRILLLDPFHGGSHAAVAAGYAAHSAHTVTLLTLPQTGGWRWRMRGGAVALARLLREHTSVPPDLLLTTDMLDLATFRALAADALPPDVPAALYMHENQLTYPLPPGRTRDLSFAWLNYTSALVADAVLFNSAFHRASFLGALPGLLGRYHDYTELHTVDTITAKAHVLPPGIDLRRHAAARPPDNQPAGPPVLLWNSRWDYDKQPEQFFAALEALEARGVDFRLIVAGDYVDPQATRFVAARERWQARLLHWGYAPDARAYSRLLHQADIVVSTAQQEFFGIGVVEALCCGCMPVLPRRLTYPDLLPPATHAACLYDTFDDLVSQLEAACTQPALRQAHDWHAIAAAYDWQALAPRYDALLATIAARGRAG